MSPKIKFAESGKLKDVNPESKRLWEKYEIDMSIRELSTSTIKAYHNDMTHLWIYSLENFDNMSTKDMSEDELVEFLYYCKRQGNNTRRIKRRMASLSAFYKFLKKKKIIKDDPTEFIDRPKKDVDIITQTFLTKDDIDNIKIALKEKFSAAKTVPARHTAISQLCYVTISLSTMARLTAICNLRWDMFDFENRIIKDVVEKEGKIVDLFYSKEVAGYLEKLIDFRKEYNIDDSGYLFVSKNNKKYTQVSKATLNSWCKKVGEMIGVPTLHPHDFRHSQATLFKEAGMALEDISVLLNHESTETTNQFYIKKDTSRIVSDKDMYE